MAEVRCWAVGIDEVRDVFAADPDLRARLVELAQPVFEPPVTPPRPPGLLGKLGPLLRRAPDAPVLPYAAPTPADADTMLSGRHVSPLRLEASWVLLRHWLDALAWGTVSLPLSDHDLDGLDFDLARAGVVSHHGVRRLWSRDARLLRPLAGMEVGYLRHDNAVALGDDWRAALARLDTDATGAATEVADFLARLSPWADEAAQVGRPVPDVVTVRTG